MHWASGVLTALITLTCAFGEREWIRRTIGPPIAANLHGEALLVLTKKEVVALLDARTGSITWRHVPSSSHSRILAFRMLSSKLVLALVDEQTSVFAQVLNSRTGQLISEVIVCDHDIKEDCKQCLEQSFRVRALDKWKIAFYACNGQPFIHDPFNGSQAAPASELLFSKTDRPDTGVKRVSVCPSPGIDAREECIQFEDRILRIDTVGRSRLTSSSGSIIFWTRFNGVSGATRCLALEREQVLAIYNGNCICGLSLRNGAYLWSLNLSPKPDQGGLASLLSTDDGQIMVVRAQVQNQRPTQTHIMSLLPRTGEITSEHTVEIDVEQVISTKRDIQRQAIVLFDKEGKSLVYRSKEVSVSTAEALKQNLYWLKKVGQCRIAGIRNGVEQWLLKTPNCQHIISVTTAEAAYSQSSFDVQQKIALRSRNSTWSRMTGGLFAVLTRDTDSSIIIVVDGTTGAILDTAKHAGFDENIDVVVSENWIAYAVWNTRLMEQELYISEFYQFAKGPLQKKFVDSPGRSNLSRTKSFIQSKASKELRVLRASYVVSSRVKTMAVTNTMHGATEKAVVLGLESGQVVIIPKVYLRPRRESRSPEDGSVVSSKPPSPFLPLYPEGGDLYVTRKLSIANLQNVLVKPSMSRESAVHIISFGLDVHHTVVAPAGSFDSLGEGFSKLGVVVTTVVLCFGTIMSRSLALRRQLRQEWS